MGDINFHWTDKVFGMALTPKNNDGFKFLYFHAAVAQHEYKVSTKVLRNSTLTKSDNYHLFSLVGNRGVDTQSLTSALDPKTGILYFTQINRHGLACWDHETKLIPAEFSKYTFQHFM